MSNAKSKSKTAAKGNRPERIRHEDADWVTVEVVSRLIHMEVQRTRYWLRKNQVPLIKRHDKNYYSIDTIEDIVSGEMRGELKTQPQVFNELMEAVLRKGRNAGLTGLQERDIWAEALLRCAAFSTDPDNGPISSRGKSSLRIVRRWINEVLEPDVSATNDPDAG